MVRKVFYSFHFKNDCWRTSQVRNIGVVEGNKPISDNDWEKIKKKGDTAVENWIEDQLKGKSCAVVLVGSSTASRKWVRKEIEKAWNAKKGIVGIRIHNLKDSNGNKSTQGDNPFEKFTLKEGQKKLSSVVKLYNSPYEFSKNVYDHIAKNIEKWVEEAVNIRDNYGKK
ncbi:MAG: TIR domain-containing protein [Candidatus Omnitrophota bacterium]